MIITLFDPPAIPSRDWDWKAYYAPKDRPLPRSFKPALNPETGEPETYFGTTEAEAVQSLLDHGLGNE